MSAELCIIESDQLKNPNEANLRKLLTAQSVLVINSENEPNQKAIWKSKKLDWWNLDYIMSSKSDVSPDYWKSRYGINGFCSDGKASPLMIEIPF